MPGIYGFSGVAPNKTNASIVAMTQAMHLYPHFKQDAPFFDQQIAASRVHLGKIGMSQSPETDLECNHVWIEGEVYNLPEVIRSFAWHGEKTSNLDFPSWLLHAYRISQLDAFLGKLDGYFCAALYDVRNQKVLLLSDRYGMRMLYWYHHNGVFAWSSEVKGLLALSEVDRTIDPSSLPCFMDLGYLMGEHTWFKNIRLIKPATVLEYDLGKDSVTQRYYWIWGEIKQSNLSFNDAVDALYEAFLESVRRRFNPNERIGISLSGGLDSRAIFAAVNALHPDFVGYAYTFGVPGCDDIRIAKEVVSRSHWQHEVFCFSCNNWFEPRKQMVWNTDGMLDMMHMHGGEFLERVAEKIDVNLNGYAGDVVAGGGWVGSFKKHTRSSQGALSNFYKSYGKLAMLDDSYFDIDNVEPGLYLSRVRRFTNMGTVNNLVAIEQRKPFFDNQVIEFAFSISEEFRQGNHIYSKMLQRYFPRFFKDIPWQKTGKPAGVVSKLSYSLPMRAIRKAIRIIEFYGGKKDNKNYTDYANWIREPDIIEQLKTILHREQSYYNNMTDQDWRQDYLEPHVASDFVDKSNQILRAATVELYLKQVYALKPIT